MQLSVHDTLHPGQLNALASVSGNELISVLIPTHRAGQGIRQDPIKLRNAIDLVQRRLSAAGHPGGELKRRFEPLRRLEGDADFWRYQGEGLAIYIRDDSADLFRLPSNFEEQVVIAPRFFLKPLFAGYQTETRFYVVIASKGSLRVLDCSDRGFHELDAEQLPASERDAVLKYLDMEKQVQHHAVSAGGGEGSQAQFHGHGPGEEDDKLRIREYFQLVHRALDRLIRDKRPPVVFAGVDYLFPLFKETADDVNLFPKHISGNFDDVRAAAKDVHARARDLVMAEQSTRLGHHLEQYGNAAASSRATSETEDVVRAALQGRVGTLFLDPSQSVPGRVNSSTNEIDMTGSVDDADNETGAEDLLNLACVETHRHGGRIFSTPGERMPNRKACAAILRY